MEREVMVPTFQTEDKSALMAAWLKEVGDEVNAGEPLFEVETNKVVSQVEAPVAGVLKACLAEEGDNVLQGQKVAVIEEASRADA